ncbi:MAG: SlyX family protein [Gammaproteobacteria bacterium]|nr:SlyX family protein [Gammaproteobacteria bacterium]MDH5653771.1 SlyX family protein [Gammaproteobacteria bacterium]
MQDQIAELESRIAFQDHTIEELNEVIIRLRQEMDTLREEITQVKSRLADLATSGVIPQSEEKPPPHY